MSPAALFIALTLAVATLYIVLPLLQRHDDPAPREARLLGAARDAQARHEMLLASLKDLEDDLATDKISVEDHALLEGRLKRQAIETLRELDAIEKRRNNPPPPGPRELEDDEAAT